MALTTPTGLPSSVKEWLRNNIPAFDADHGALEAMASMTDLTTIVAELLSNAAGKGASTIGIEDAGGLITATTVEAALAELATALSAGGAAPSTSFGVLSHVKVPAVGGSGGIGNVNWGRVVVPTGTWEIVDVHWVLRGNGTQGDSVQCYIDAPIGAYVTSSIDISSKSDQDVVRAAKIDDSNNVVVGNGATQIMAAFATTHGNDVPPHDMHVTLRQTA